MSMSDQKPYLDAMGITSWQERKSPDCPDASVAMNRGTDWLVIMPEEEATPDNLALLDKILAAAKAQNNVAQVVQEPEVGSKRNLEEWVKFAKTKLILIMGESLAQALIGTGIDLQSFRQKSWPVTRVSVPIVVTHPLSSLSNQALKRETWHDVQYAQGLIS